MNQLPKSDLLPGLQNELGALEVTFLPINEIKLRERIRELDEDKLADLSFSIKNDGLLQPLVVALFEGAYVLVAGQHRLEVCKRLRWNLVPVRVFSGIEDKEHLIRLELSENLFRNELSVLERAVHLSEYLKRNSALRALNAEEIAKTVNISRRTFFYYKQVATLNPELIQKILKLPQDLKNSKTQLLDFYNIPNDEIRTNIISTLEGNPAATYRSAKSSVTQLAVESGDIDKPLTITQVTRKRIQELKKVQEDYFKYTNTTMSDLVDYCLGLGLQHLKQKNYEIEIPPLVIDTKNSNQKTEII